MADVGVETAAGDQAKRGLTDVRPIKGVYSFGLPAVEDGAGTVLFILDGNTLEVNATALSGRLGADGDMSRADVAYAVAASVLDCWEHHA